jgi:hypothetical protein
VFFFLQKKIEARRQEHQRQSTSAFDNVGIKRHSYFNYRPMASILPQLKTLYHHLGAITD